MSMNSLTAQGVLLAWEHAQREHPLMRSQALLRAAWPEVDASQWGAMPLGARDAWLFRLQDALFGPELDTVVACPSCDEPLQARLSTTDLQAPAADAGAGQPGASLRCEGYELDYRLPCNDDLLAVAATPDEPADIAAHRLLQRCVLEARHGGAAAPLDALPPTVIDGLQAAMAQAAPGADTSVALACPACGHGFERRFDIGAYLWEELDDWAQHTLAEVHVLAGAYGWSESQILALGAARRAHYIALVQS